MKSPVNRKFAEDIADRISVITYTPSKLLCFGGGIHVIV